jgi:hypothetical protein
VDIARRPYSTDARFHKESDQVVRIRWYPAAEPVEVLPFPSKINSLDWSSHPYLAAGVGEVYGVPRPYNAAAAIPYARGLAPCQPAAVFTDGEELDPDAPPQLYDDLGFPLCCLNHVTMEGGIEWNGTGEISGEPAACICDDATVVTAPSEEWWELPCPGRLGPGFSGWWRLLTPPGSNVRLTFLACTDPLATLTYNPANHCGSPFIGGTFGVGGSVDVLGTTLALIWWTIEGSPDPSQFAKFRVEFL